MKSILTMAWTADDPAAFELAAKLVRALDARLVGLEPPSYGVMSMAWADAGMGAPIGGGLARRSRDDRPPGCCSGRTSPPITVTTSGRIPARAAIVPSFPPA